MLGSQPKLILAAFNTILHHLWKRVAMATANTGATATSSYCSSVKVASGNWPPPSTFCWTPCWPEAWVEWTPLPFRAKIAQFAPSLSTPGQCVPANTFLRYSVDQICVFLQRSKTTTLVTAGFSVDSYRHFI